MSTEPNSNDKPAGPADDVLMSFEAVDPAELNIHDDVVNDDISTLVFVEKKPGFGFWKAVLWCLLFLLVTQLFVGILALFGIWVLNGAPTQKAELAQVLSRSDQQIVMATIAVGSIVTILFSWCVTRWVVGSEWPRKLGFRRPAWQHVLLILIGLPALWVALIPVESMVLRHVPTIRDLVGSIPGVDKQQIPEVTEVIKGTSSWPWWIAVLLIGVGPAIGEELWCRGFLGQGLASRYGSWASVLLASFFFGLIHLEPPQVVMAFLMGIVLHLTYLATRSIYIPMLIHFLNNSLIILMLSRDGHVPFLDTLEIAYQFNPIMMSIASLIMLLLVGVALFESRVRCWTSDGLEATNCPYSHVEHPPENSRFRVLAGPIPLLESTLVLAAAAFFSAVWFGWVGL